MKTTIVCGVLGAGKTTFLGNVLRNTKEKAVVLVNDFGEAGIDGEILSAGGIDTIELPSGCVCCTLRFDLINSIQKIVEQHSPDHLYIEPSGIASPGGVTEVLDTLGISPVTVVGIVDVTDFLEALEQDMYGWFFRSQITRSDIIIVNKTDLVDQEKTSATIETIESMNPHAVIVSAVNAQIEPLMLPRGRGSQNIDRGHDHDIGVETVTIRLNSTVSRATLQAFFEGLAAGKYGKVIRAKSLVMTDEGACRLDLASGRVNLREFGKEVDNSRIVVIGSGLDQEGLLTALTNY